MPVDADYADQFVVLEHRHGDEGAGTADVSERSNRRITIEVGLGRSQIIDMHYLPRSRDPAETAAGIGTDHHALANVCVGGWDVMQRASAERLAVIEIERPEFCITQPHRISQHCLEYRLQLTGRRADDPQHIGRRRLLLQRLTQIIRTLAQLIEQAGVLDGNDGLRGEVLQQLDLLIGEWADLLPVDSDAADHPVLSEHWNEEQSACARQPH